MTKGKEFHVGIAMGHELIARIAKDPDRRLKIIQEFYIEKSNAGDPDVAHQALLYKVLAEAKQPQQHRSHARRKIIIWTASGVGLLVLLLLASKIIPIFCTSTVKVPESHFVGEHGHNKRLIVFVHGVLGDMDNTWRNPKTGDSWPELIRGDETFKDFDVFVYGYSSPLFGQASEIDEIAQRFAQQLKDWRIFRNYEEVDFVTHSMGGIVTKRMLNTLNTPSEIGNLHRVHCVIYMAVPSNGADLAALASWISRNPQFRSMSPANAASFLRSVEFDWAALLRARSQQRPFPRTFSAYEKLSTNSVMVVPELYTSELSDGPIMAFDYNHADIVKPANRQTDVYVWVSSRIIESGELTSISSAPISNMTHVESSGSQSPNVVNNSGAVTINDQQPSGNKSRDNKRRNDKPEEKKQ
jgi:pimeloyl-ACP methyl ester carboxylesterase